MTLEKRQSRLPTVDFRAVNGHFFACGAPKNIVENQKTDYEKTLLRHELVLFFTRPRASSSGLNTRCVWRHPVPRWPRAHAAPPSTRGGRCAPEGALARHGASARSGASQARRGCARRAGGGRLGACVGAGRGGGRGCGLRGTAAVGAGRRRRRRRRRRRARVCLGCCCL